MAMALFAHIAAPQVRLTKDPNTFFFFLDHLGDEAPFRLEEDTTWDTNIELGIEWGIRLIERDQEVFGRSPNAKTFVLVTDGQAWSGEVARALEQARSRDVPVYVVGVGTTAGDFIPEPPRKPGDASTARSPIRASLDRASLGMIATAGGGEYLELDREDDRQIANRIIDASRRRAGTLGMEPATEELYRPLLLIAFALVCAGLFFVQERGELGLHAAGAGMVLAIVWTLIR
jgi:hypothetical protein